MTRTMTEFTVGSTTVLLNMTDAERAVAERALRQHEDRRFLAWLDRHGEYSLHSPATAAQAMRLAGRGFVTKTGPTSYRVTDAGRTFSRST